MKTQQALNNFIDSVVAAYKGGLSEKVLQLSFEREGLDDEEIQLILEIVRLEVKPHAKNKPT